MNSLLLSVCVSHLSVVCLSLTKGFPLCLLTLTGYTVWEKNNKNTFCRNIFNGGGTWRDGSGAKYSLLFSRTQARFPAPMWCLPTICSSSIRGSDYLFWPLQASSALGTHTYKVKTHRSFFKNLLTVLRDEVTYPEEHSKPQTHHQPTPRLPPIFNGGYLF